MYIQYPLVLWEQECARAALTTQVCKSRGSSDLGLTLVLSELPDTLLGWLNELHVLFVSALGWLWWKSFLGMGSNGEGRVGSGCPGEPWPLPPALRWKYFILMSILFRGSLPGLYPQRTGSGPSQWLSSILNLCLPPSPCWNIQDWRCSGHLLSALGKGISSQALDSPQRGRTAHSYKGCTVCTSGLGWPRRGSQLCGAKEKVLVGIVQREERLWVGVLSSPRRGFQ